MGKIATVQTGDIKRFDEEFEQISFEINRTVQGRDGLEKLLNALNSEEIRLLLVEAFNSKNEVDNKHKYRAMPAYNEPENESFEFKSVARKLFVTDVEADLKTAIRGLFFARGLYDSNENKQFYKIESILPRFRFHLFVRNLEGLWLSFKEDLNSVISLHRDANPFNTLKETSEISINGFRAFEGLYCENCGTMFVGGTKIKYGDDETFSHEIISTPPEIEKVPEKATAAMIEARTEDDYGIFWPKSYITNLQDWEIDFYV